MTVGAAFSVGKKEAEIEQILTEKLMAESNLNQHKITQTNMEKKKQSLTQTTTKTNVKSNSAQPRKSGQHIEQCTKQVSSQARPRITRHIQRTFRPLMASPPNYWQLQRTGTPFRRRPQFHMAAPSECVHLLPFCMALQGLSMEVRRHAPSDMKRIIQDKTFKLRGYQQPINKIMKSDKCSKGGGHICWNPAGDCRYDGEADDLLTFINENNINFLNDGHITRVSEKQNEADSAIDLSLISSHLHSSNPTSIKHENWQLARLNAKEIIQNAKKQGWQNFCSKITHKTNSKELWEFVRKVKGTPLPDEPPFKIGDKVIHNQKDMADILVEHYEKISSDKECTQHFIDIKNRTYNIINEREDIKYNADCSMIQLNRALANCKSGAPGEDGIHYDTLKKLPTPAKQTLLCLFNQSWKSGSTPESG
ncbi:hypothetical protein MAR_037304, partial [Mya arenaria]